MVSESHKEAITKARIPQDLQKKTEVNPVQILARDPKIGAWNSAYPDGSVDSNSRKLFDAKLKSGENVETFRLNSGEIAMVGPVGDVAPTDNPDKLPPRRLGDKAGLLKDNDVGHINGQIWTYLKGKEEKSGRIKILFSVREGDETVVYVGGDRKTPTELYRYKTDKYRVFIPRLTNKGRSKNKFTASAYAQLNVDIYAKPLEYQTRIIINLKTKEEIILEPDVWVPRPFVESTTANYYPVEIAFRGNGFYSSGSRQGGYSYGANGITDIPAFASSGNVGNPENIALFGSAWGPGGGGYNAGKPGASGSQDARPGPTIDDGFSFAIKSRNYWLEIGGGGLQTILGDASVYRTNFTQYLTAGFALDYSVNTSGCFEQINVNLGLNIEETVYYKYDLRGSNPPDTATFSHNIRSSSTVIVGDVGVIFAVYNSTYLAVYPGGEQTNNYFHKYYYKDINGNQIELPDTFYSVYPFPEHFNSNRITNYNLIKAKLYCCDSYLNDFYPSSLPHNDYMDVAIISLDGSTIVIKEKIESLPTTQNILHNISYYP